MNSSATTKIEILETVGFVATCYTYCNIVKHLKHVKDETFRTNTFLVGIVEFFFFNKVKSSQYSECFFDRIFLSKRISKNLLK